MKVRELVRLFLPLAAAAAALVFFRFSSPVGQAVVLVLPVVLAAFLSIFWMQREHSIRNERLMRSLSNLVPCGKAEAACTAQDELDGEIKDLFSDLKAQIRRAYGLNKGILEGLPIPYLLTDEFERTVSTNAATMEMLEIDGDPKSQYGRTLAEVFYNDPGRPTAVGKSIHEGKVFSNLEVTITGHKGGKRHVLANVFPLYDETGTCIGGLCLYLNMSELKAKQEALDEHNNLLAKTAHQAEAIAGDLTLASDALRELVAATGDQTAAQARNMQEVASTVDHAGQTAAQISRNATQADDIAQMAKEQAEKGTRLMADVLGGMEDLSKGSEQIRQDMDSLSNKAASIGGILSVISDIADQTNLLALNAAIEAARAGDAGRGFAVVADEVRKLAEKTMSATKEVSEHVGAIGDSVRQSSQSTAKALATVQTTVDMAKTAEQTLTQIASLVSRTSQEIRGIAQSSREQSDSGAQAGRVTSEMAAMAQKDSEAMSEASLAVEQLQDLVKELRALVSAMVD